MRQFAIVLLMAIASSALAAAPIAAAVLSWQDCVREAETGNPDFASSRAALRSSMETEKAGGGERFPQVSASAGYTRSERDGSSNSDETATDSYDAGLSARQLLFSSGRLPATLDQRRAEVEAAEAALRRAAHQVGYDLKSAFAGVLYAQALERLAGQIRDRRDENLRLVELRFDGGREHKGSLLRIKAAAREAQFEVGRAERARAVAQRDLARALGRAESDGLVVEGGYQVASPQVSPDFGLLAAASPLQDQAEARRRVAAAAVRRARSAFYPELSGTASLTRDGDQFFPGEERWSVGVALDVPVFAGGARRHELAAARADEAQAEADLMSTTYDVRRELEQAHAALVDDVENLGVRQEFLEAAQVRAEIARSQYTSGLLSFEDWDLIENDLISTEKSLLAARRDALLSEAAWDLASGKDVFHAP